MALKSSSSSSIKALLATIIFGQIGLCILRYVNGDITGAVEDGVVALVGGVAMFEAFGVIPALLYGTVCAGAFAYDALVGWSILRHTKFTIGSHVVETGGMMSSVALAAPVLSIAGCLLSMKIYIDRRPYAGESDCGEKKPFASGGQVKYCRDMGSRSSTSSATSSPPLWPAPPTPPLPALCSRLNRPEPTRGPRPFQAIFGAPVEKSKLLPALHAPQRSPTPPPSVVEEDSFAVI